MVLVLCLELNRYAILEDMMNHFSRQDGYELWIRFIQHYKVKNVNLPLFYYRQHSKESQK